MPIQSYQDLEIWQRSMELAEKIYRLTKDFPPQEQYGMTSQMRRAAVSIPANIAEGWGRSGSKEFQRFLDIALGSLRELETHLILCQRIALCTEQQAKPLQETMTILGKQIVTLKRKLGK